MGLKKGTRLQDRYVITEIIARGGEGDVYKAIDERWDKLVVAIKETRFDDNESLRQFQSGAMMLRKLHHENLPKVYDHFSEADSQFLVMDYIEGDDLLTLLKRRTTPFPAEQIMTWAKTLLETLKYLHSRSPVIIHRDIKPQNIKITSNGHIYLLDFGLAKHTSTSRSQNSMHGYTLHYAPPEQIRKLGTDERSDIYSLGATIYHLLANKEPINAQVREELSMRAATDPMQVMFDKLPSPFNSILSRAMSISAAERYTSAEEFLVQLLKAGVQQPSAPLNYRHLLLILLIIAVVLGGGVGYMMRKHAVHPTAVTNHLNNDKLTPPTTPFIQPTVTQEVSKQGKPLSVSSTEQSAINNGNNVNGAGIEYGNDMESNLSRNNRKPNNRLSEIVRPSFDCSNATWPTEKIICSSEMLSTLDRNMDDAYRNAKYRNPKFTSFLKKNQNNWIRKERETCKNNECLRRLYTARIVYLDSFNIIDKQSTLTDRTVQYGNNNNTASDNSNSKPIGEHLQLLIIEYPKPTYTEEARANNTQGEVELKVLFKSDGQVDSIEVIRGLPDGLTERAIEAARKIKFTPATKNGVPVSIRKSIIYTFKAY
jgi:TonB family protein